MADISRAHPNLEIRVIETLRDVLGPGIYSLHEPRFGGNERRYLEACLDSTFVSSVGAYVDQFESQLALFTGVKHAVAVVNGTAALQVALQVAGVRRNDEVLVPTLSFVATANAVSYLGAVPHFVDSNRSTLGVDPEALKSWLKYISEPTSEGVRNRFTGRRISALVPMHTFGHPCQLDDLVSVTRDFKLAMVEDAAEALGSFYNGKHVGSFGKLGVISFNGNKVITTGGGGAILTNDESLAASARHLTTTCKVSHRWSYQHDQIGYNFRMPNLNAALGCAQLEHLPTFLCSKRRLAALYKQAFASYKELTIFEEPKWCESNYWLQTALLNSPSKEKLSDILEKTNDDGLGTRPAWNLLHTLQPYKSNPRSPLPVSENLACQILNLPSSAGLV